MNVEGMRFFSKHLRIIKLHSVPPPKWISHYFFGSLSSTCALMLTAAQPSAASNDGGIAVWHTGGSDQGTQPWLQNTALSIRASPTGTEMLRAFHNDH